MCLVIIQIMSVIKTNIKKRKRDEEESTEVLRTEKWIATFFYWKGPSMFVEMVDKITVDDILEFCRFRAHVQENQEYVRQRNIVMNACGGVFSDAFRAHDSFYDFMLLMIVVTDRFVTRNLLQIHTHPDFYPIHLKASTSSIRLVGKTGVLSPMYTYCSIERQGLIQPGGRPDSYKSMADAMIGAATRIIINDLDSPWSINTEMLELITSNVHLKYIAIREWPQAHIHPMFYLIPKSRLSMISRFMHVIHQEKRIVKDLYKELSSTVFSTDVGSFRHLFSNVRQINNKGTIVYTSISSQFIKHHEKTLTNRSKRVKKSSAYKLGLVPMEVPWDESQTLRSERMNLAGVKRMVHEAVFGPMETFCNHITTNLESCFIDANKRHIQDVLQTAKSLASQTFTEPWGDMGVQNVNGCRISTREEFLRLCIDTFPMRAK